MSKAVALSDGQLLRQAHARDYLGAVSPGFPVLLVNRGTYAACAAWSALAFQDVPRGKDDELSGSVHLRIGAAPRLEVAGQPGDQSVRIMHQARSKRLLCRSLSRIHTSKFPASPNHSSKMFQPSMLRSSV